MLVDECVTARLIAGSSPDAARRSLATWAENLLPPRLGGHLQGSCRQTVKLDARLGCQPAGVVELAAERLNQCACGTLGLRSSCRAPPLRPPLRGRGRPAPLLLERA